MKLVEVLEKVDSEYVPLKAEQSECFKRYEIDSRPGSTFKVCICFMCEESTWVHTYANNEILVPWYECEVHSFYAEDDELLIWLYDVDFLINEGLIKKEDRQ